MLAMIPSACTEDDTKYALDSCSIYGDAIGISINDDEDDAVANSIRKI